MVSFLTKLRFVCVARVTDEHWTACAVKDDLNFGLRAGDDLILSTTICKDVRERLAPVVIDAVSRDPIYSDHITPKIYQFESYFSIPLIRENGEYFGSLCGIDSVEREISDPKTIASLGMLAELISLQLKDSHSLVNEREEFATLSRNGARDLAVMNQALVDEKVASELRETFVGVLGHDLRNPINSILLGASVLEKMSLDEKAMSIVGRVRRSALRMSGMVNDILDFTRGRMAGGIPAVMQFEHNMLGVFEHVISELRSAYPEREIIVKFPSLIELQCDPGRLGQALSNLLKNALAHGDESSPVIVTGVKIGSWFELAVENAGKPIPADQHGALFEAFTRLKNNSEGLGLGLFIVSEIARSHGGTVQVNSEAERTVFSMRIPC
ncbi:HAMP domain-containing sensor histidine kinase [Herbaspirillum lusitanum]|uniref:histidine kinase n=1 Tax=Herbaspirillum lusitanum TaxID=213312 RepID=A0ABW9A8H3_9BURK